MNKFLKRPIVFFSIAILFFVVLGLIDSILFHFFIDIFIIFIGLLLFVIAINSRVYSEKTILLVLAVSYLYISCLDFMHLLTHVGMGGVEKSLNQSYQFFATARVFEASIFIVSFALKKEPKRVNYIHTQLIGAFIFVVSTIVILRNLSLVYYVDGVGQTGVEIFVSYFTAALFIIAILLIGRKNLGENQKRLLIIMLVLKVVAQLFHANFIEVGDMFQIASMILRFVSYCILYVVFIQQIVNDPYTNVYSLFETKEKELLRLSQRDSLTGLFNHSITLRKIEHAICQIGKGHDTLCVILFDIDNFKKINDTYGHIKGDEILTSVTGIISNLNILDQVVGRYGGDEFVLVLPDIVESDIGPLFDTINSELLDLSNVTGVNITLSAGVVLWTKEDDATDLIRKADIKMYQSKAKGKNQYSIWEENI